MDTTATKPTQNGRSQPRKVDPVISVLIPKERKTTLEKFEEKTNKDEDKGCCLTFDNACCSMLGRWWNVRYKCQQAIGRFVERPLFHIAIIVLVLIDCLLVMAELMLDFIKLKKPCGTKTLNHTSSHDQEREHHRIELAVEILHYSSLALLALFLVEVLIKVYAFGRHWWNFHEKKMEWLDAIIVIASFAIDLATMHKSNVFTEISLLFISLRLWRLIRIINSVAQTIRAQDEAHKKHLTSSYYEVVDVLLNISEKKTLLIEEFGREMTKENFDIALSKLEKIDQSCRQIHEHCPHPSSFDAVTEIAHHLHDVIEKLGLVSSTMSPSVDK